MPDRNDLLQSIHPGMKLGKAFFLRIYGYEISYPGFSDQAIQALEAAGCSKARVYYDQITDHYQQGQDEVMRSVPAWYVGECEKKWKEGDLKRTQQKDNKAWMAGMF